MGIPNSARRFLPSALSLFLLFPSILFAQTDFPSMQVAQRDPLYDTLLSGALQDLPAGFTSPTTSAGPVDEVDKSDGMTGNVQITFQGDPKAKVNYLFFATPDDARKYSLKIAQQITSTGGSRRFLVNVPSADCIDSQEHALCHLQSDQVVLVTFATNVSDGAGPLVKMGLDHLTAVKKTLGITPEQQQTSEQENAAPKGDDPCTLLTKEDAEAMLGQTVRDARRDSANACFYGSQTNPGDSVMIQLIDGGAEKLAFDRSRMSKTVPVTGIGSDSFAFVSPAGFIQLCFVKSNQYVALMVSKRKDSRLLDASKTLASKVAARIP
jgi:hypothetical protein